jgi:hypothetical protein
LNSSLGCAQIGQTFKNLQKNILFKKLFFACKFAPVRQEKKKAAPQPGLVLLWDIYNLQKQPQSMWSFHHGTSLLHPTK